MVYTVSDMLNGINEVMGPLGGSVELKKDAGNGVMFDTSRSEIHALDSKARVKAAGESIAHLTRMEKLKWVDTQRQLGNEAYHQKEYSNAAEIYVQALVGLDFGDSDDEKVDVQQQYQIPITVNLAAALMGLRAWSKVVQICNEVLALDAHCSKALRRRGFAYSELFQFDNARTDLNLALQYASKTKEVQLIRKNLKQVELSQHNDAEKQLLQKRKDCKVMQKAFGHMYDDKKNAEKAPVAEAVPAVNLKPQVSFTHSLILFVLSSLFIALSYFLFNNKRRKQ